MLLSAFEELAQTLSNFPMDTYQTYANTFVEVTQQFSVERIGMEAVSLQHIGTYKEQVYTFCITKWQRSHLM